MSMCTCLSSLIGKAEVSAAVGVGFIVGAAAVFGDGGVWFLDVFASVKKEPKHRIFRYRASAANCTVSRACQAIPS